MPKKTITQESEGLRVSILFRQGVYAQLAGLINVGIYAYCIHEIVAMQSILLWIALAVFVTALRVVVQSWFINHYLKPKKEFDAQFWEYVFIVGAFLMGSVWGVAATFLLPLNSVAHYAFLGFILAGNTAGAAVAYCTSYRSLHAILIPSILPFGITMLLDGGSFQLSMAVLLCLYVAVVSITMKRMNRYVVECLELRFHTAKVEHELIEARAKATDSAKMAALGEMAGGIAHEINNPLAIIKSYNGVFQHQLKAEQIDRDRLMELTHKLDATTVRIAKIVSGLKMFSRDAGHDPLEKVSIKTIIHQTLDFCQSRFKSKDIPIHIEDCCENVQIICRSAQISQVLLNLLNNAFDAIKDQPDSWVRVEVQCNHDKVTVAVVDSGSGIPAEIHAKIMQPFFTTKKVGEGTGLGLSIAHGIMKGHGGTLKLDQNSSNTRFLMEFQKVA